MPFCNYDNYSFFEATKLKKFCLLLFASLFLLQYRLPAQVENQYNLNIYNGLPTNHVYCIMIDGHGYLWMGTEKGVLQYNGYELKQYNYAEGLLNEEVFGLREDKKGRIWFFSITDQMGYVKNNKYHQIYNPTKRTLYPRETGEYDSSIVFTSPYFNEPGRSLCVEKHDTTYSLQLQNIGSYFIGDDKIFIHTDTSLSEMSFHITKQGTIDTSVKFLSTIDGNNNYYPMAVRHLEFGLHNYLIQWEPKHSILVVTDTKRYRRKLIDVRNFSKENETVLLTFHVKNELFIATEKNIYFLDSEGNFKRSYSIRSILNDTTIDGAKVSCCINDVFWSQAIATYTNGVFINYPSQNKYFNRKNNYDLHGYIYLGGIKDSMHFWWNNTERTLAKINRSGEITYHQYKDIYAADKLVYFNNEALLLTRLNTRLIDCHTGKIINQDTARHYSINNIPFDLIKDKSLYDIIADSPGSMYVISKGEGFSHIQVRDNVLLEKVLNNERYNGIIYDSTQRAYIVYNNDKIAVFRNNIKISSFGNEELKTLGLKNIDKILIDNYRNIFIKEHDKLHVFNIGNGSFYTLLDNYVLSGALMYLRNKRLIVAGKFGIAFIKINGSTKFSSPIVYHNIKGITYTDVIDAQVSDREVLLNTYNGAFAVSIPGDTAFNMHQTDFSQPYKFILSYRDTLFDIKQYDTIRIDQKYSRLQFDVINPAGNGALKYEYYLPAEGNGWQELNANELNIHQLSAGKWYELSLRVHDDVWRSNGIHMVLYIVPLWWQTLFWKTIFWIAGIVLSILLFLTSIFSTRRVVMKKNAKRNHELELELKSLYSQINPHFVFNALTSIQSLIQKDRKNDAYMQVSKFSKLLRSYIYSSRNKFITITDEIENLKNYIELQQSRFNNKFDYEIIVAAAIDANAVKIPALLLQPLVENAITHGLFHKQNDGFLKIIFEKDAQQQLVCIIDDNGIGRKRSKQIKDRSLVKNNSYGDELVKELILVLNEYENLDIKMKYIDKEWPLTGTIVEIRLNNRSI